MNPSIPRFSLIGAALLFLSTPAYSATFIVANGDVAGLKTAMTTCNSNAQDDTIELFAGGTYVLTGRDNALNGLPQITPDGGHSLTIHGNGATIQRAVGSMTFRIFYIQSGANATLSGLTVINGSPGAFHGGAIYNDGESANATLTISGCTITGCSGDYGGAIFNDGESGSAVFGARLTIVNSTISGNTGTQYGGGIWSDGSFGSATLNVSNSTFTQNSANLDTGAIQHDAFSGVATGSITNCTFDRNSAGRNGGAVYIDGESGNATLSITNCTFSQNTAATTGGGIYNTTGVSGGSAVTQIGNTIFKTGTNGANLLSTGSGGTVTSLGHNLSNDNGSGLLIGAGDITSTDPMLDAAGLQNNGGPTQTIGLQSISPAINAGNNANAPARDQRYYLRNGVSDIGAFEFGGTIGPVISGSSKTHGVAGTFSIDLPLSGTVGVECRSGGANGDYQVVATFATPVTATSASITSGTGMASLGGVSGSQVTVNLTGVTNAQQIAITITGVSDGVHTNNVIIPMAVLLGDTNGDRSVNSGDIAQTKSKSGQTVDATNFREDVNVDGSLNSGDISLVKSKSGTGLIVSDSVIENHK